MPIATVTSPAEYHLAKDIRAALGLPFRTPNADENPACLSMWSIRELQDIYARNGGTVVARPVTRGGLSDGSTYDVIEMVLTIDLGSLGVVAVVTDWDPADEAYGFALPVVQARQIGPECPVCAAPADASGHRIPAHRPGSPCTVDYRAIGSPPGCTPPDQASPSPRGGRTAADEWRPIE